MDEKNIEDNIEKYLKTLEKEIKQDKKTIAQAEQLERLQEISRAYEGDDKVISSLEVLDEMKKKPPEHKMFSGIAKLDYILDGFRPKQLIVISARAKSGKTSMIVDLARRLAVENPMLVLYEEPPEEIVQKFLDRNEEPPLFYTPRKNQMYKLSWLEERIIEAKAKYNSKIVFVDHLDFLVPMSQNRHDLQMADTMRQLKGLAKKWDIIIVILAHLKMVDPTVAPTTNDLRGTASIEQEADTVIMLWRQAEKINGMIEFSDNVNLSVQANRRTGKTGNVKLVFKDGKFIEENWTTAEEEFNTM